MYVLKIINSIKNVTNYANRNDLFLIKGTPWDDIIFLNEVVYLTDHGFIFSYF